MCLMERHVYKWNNNEAYKRMITDLRARYGNKHIHGAIYSPYPRKVKGWPDMNRIDKEYHDQIFLGFIEVDVR